MQPIDTFMKPVINTVILAVITVSGLIACAEIRKEITVMPGTPILHDDIEYYVSAFEKVSSLTVKDSTVKTDGTFYIVTFKVMNRAKRADHTWDNQVAYIIDEHDTIYENNMQLQKKLSEIKSFNFKETYVTPFQSEENTVLVFEVPADVKKPYLKVRGRILMGDFLDGSTFEKTKVKLFIE